MSAQNDLLVPERKVYTGKAILPVKNAPIDINVDREAELTFLPKQPANVKATKTTKEEKMTEGEAKAAVRYIIPSKPVNGEVQIGEEKMTEDKKISEGASPQNKTALPMEVDDILQKTEEIDGYVAEQKMSGNNITKRYGTRKIKIPDDLNKSIQEEEAQKIFRKGEQEIKKRKAEAEIERAKRTDTYVSTSAVMKQIRQSEARDNLKGMASLMEKCHEDMDKRVKIITRTDRGKRARLFAKLLYIDADENMLLGDVVLTWKRKTSTEAATGSESVPIGLKRMIRGSGLVEKHLGDGIWLCQRRITRWVLRNKDVLSIELVDSEQTDI